MKGFELSLNGKKKAAFFGEDRVVTLTIDLLAEESCRLCFGGADRASNYQDTFVWMDTALELGDRISLSVKELDEESESCHPVRTNETSPVTPEKAAFLRERYRLLEQMLASFR